MKKGHRNRHHRKFCHAIAGKRIPVLNVPDDYESMQRELVELLKTKCAQYPPWQTAHFSATTMQPIAVTAIATGSSVIVKPSGVPT